MALCGIAAGTASATTLSVGGVKQNKAVSFTSSLASGTSMILKDEFGTTTDTCSQSSLAGSTEGTFTAATVGGKASTFSFGNCTHKTTVLKIGKVTFRWLFGIFLTISFDEFEWKTVSTFFGAEATCKTGTGTDIGTVTGVESGNATIHVNATVNCGILGNASWTGTYSVSSPSGLAGAN
jgi:hypothetical protein